MSTKISIETRPIVKVGDNDTWKEFCFVSVLFPISLSSSRNLTAIYTSVVRTVPRRDDNTRTEEKPTFKVVIKSEYLLKACKDVFQTLPGISWTAELVEVCCTFLKP
jgi:hypothetical protein